MKKRDYLRSLGFRVGDRGRFTEGMKIALAQYDGVFEEDIKPLDLDKLKDFKKAKTSKSYVHVAQEQQREARTLTGMMDDGTKVGFVLCANCNQHMIWCNCPEGVHAPRLVTHSRDPLVFVSNV